MKIDTTQLTALHAQHEKIAKRPTARSASDWYNIAPGNGDTTTVYMYAEIGFYGVTSADFVNELAQIKTANIDLHINSLGGEIFEGTAIMAAIADHPAYVTGIVDGIAASAASFILMACDKIVIRPEGLLMIHDGQGITAGDQRAHEASASILGKLSDVIAGVYAKRAGGTPEDWRARMLAESWFNATEAKALGLADEIYGDEPDVPASAEPPAAMRAKYDLSIFRNHGMPTLRETETVELPEEPDVSEVDEPFVTPESPASVTPEVEPVNAFDTRAFRMALLAAELTGC